MHDDSISLGGFLTLTNVGATYDATNPSAGLGCALVNFLGIQSIDFTVIVNKIGTGVQSWQLWNETDGSEIGVIDDAGAAGNKVLAANFNGGAVPNGTKLVRVRAKSTVAADDPIYRGATLLLKRPPMTFERLGLAEQITRNVYGLTRNMRDNANGYKSQLAAERPVAEIATVMVGDAGQYLIRLGWMTTLATNDLPLLARTLADYGNTPSQLAAFGDSLVAVAEHTQAASLTTGAEITAEADFILANVPNYGRLW